jgi:hypothetical protein
VFFFQNYSKIFIFSAVVVDLEPFDTVMETPKKRNPNERARHAAAASYSKGKKMLSFFG